MTFVVCSRAAHPSRHGYWCGSDLERKEQSEGIVGMTRRCGARLSFGEGMTVSATGVIDF